MKIVIFLMVQPRITETFILNEFEILDTNNIEFLVSLTYERTRVNQSLIQKYKKHFLYIPRYSKNIFLVNLFRVLFYQFIIFFLYPWKYIKVIIWIAIHYDNNFLRNFLRISVVIPTIGKFDPDLFYCRYAKDALISSFLVSKFFNKKFGIIYYSVYPNLPYIKHINSRISFIIVKAKYIKNIYIKTYPDIDKNKIKVIPWGIDTKYFHKNKISNTKNVFTILAISQMTEKKGLIYLAKACQLLFQQNITFRCTMIGDGSEKIKIRNFIKKNNLNKYIKLIKAIPHSQKFKQYMNDSDVFVLPSVIDSKGDTDVIPNVLLEAMAMQLPVITTKISGMLEVIKDKKNGFLVKENDEKDMAKAIKRVMDLPTEELLKIGKNARNTIVSRYNKEIQGKKFINFLKSVAN